MIAVICKYCKEEIDIWDIWLHLETCLKREDGEEEKEEMEKTSK